jgi:hypothetical protein
MTTTPKFDTAFATFLAGCKKIHDEYVRKNFTNIVDSEIAREWRVDAGKVRCRVVHGGSAYCFVDYATGDVLKCDGYKAPAKHARGNIYDAANGLGTIGPYGPAYLR